jgi:phage terminase large subunit-like protein
LRHAARCGGKARGLILRKYLTDLRDFIAETQKYLPKLGWTWRQQDKQWIGPDGSVLNLGYLEREQDAEGQQGWNLSYLAMDEAGQHATPFAIDLLRACLRLTGVPEHLLRLTANPGGPGHKWLKERYVDPAPRCKPHSTTITLPDGEKIKSTRVFIPARLRDNPLCDTPEYRKNLFLSAGGRAWLVKAWLEGDWNVQPAGGIFDVEKVNFGDLPALLPCGGNADFGAPVIDRIWQGWDTAYTVKSKNDEWAGGTAGRDDRSRFWLINLEHGHWDCGEGPRRVVAQQRQYRAGNLLVEGGPAGLAVEPSIRDAINMSMGSDDPILTNFELVSHTLDKVAKNAAFASAVNSGQIWVPTGANWWPYMRDQMLTFSGIDGIPDDCVDCFGVCFRELNRIFKASPAAKPKAEDPHTLRPDIQARRAEIRTRMDPYRPSGDGVRTMFGGR